MHIPYAGIWHWNQTFVCTTVASAPTMTALVFMRVFRFFWYSSDMHQRCSRHWFCRLSGYFESQTCLPVWLDTWYPDICEKIQTEKQTRTDARTDRRKYRQTEEFIEIRMDIKIYRMLGRRTDRQTDIRTDRAEWQTDSRRTGKQTAE